MSAGAIEWTPLFRFYRRDGRLTSGMVGIGQFGPENRQYASSRETRIDPGGGSASRISDTCTERQIGINMSREEQQLPRDDNEAMVVGAVGSGTAWFLTGWSEGTEVEFIIDTR